MSNIKSFKFLQLWNFKYKCLLNKPYISDAMVVYWLALLPLERKVGG